MCARLHVVQYKSNLNTGHSHPYINKARTTYVMLARASTISLPRTQSHNPSVMRELIVCGWIMG